MGVARAVLLRASESARLRDLFQRRGLARSAVARFMPGESVDAALAALEAARPAGIGGVLTRLGEHIRDLTEADGVVDHYLEVLGAIAARGLDAHVSIKLTQLGLDAGVAEAARRVARLASRAAESGAPLWIDMESSAWTEATLELYRELLPQHPNLGLCLQAYLRRTAADLDDLLERGGRIRLVKGAYQESASIAFPRKSDVDAAFLRQASALVTDAAGGGACHAIATHDLPLLDKVREVARTRGAAAGAWEVHMLFGIQSAAQRRLAAEGVRVRVLVSYGEYWYPWFVRRLAERPANVLFVLRALLAP